MGQPELQQEMNRQEIQGIQNICSIGSIKSTEIILDQPDPQQEVKRQEAQSLQAGCVKIHQTKTKINLEMSHP